MKQSILGTLLIVLPLLVGRGAGAVADSALLQCGTIKDTHQRLECYDRLSREVSVSVTTSAESRWNIRSEISPLDDSRNVYLSLEGDSDFSGWLSKYRPSLVLRCKEYETAVYVITGMPLSVEYGGDYSTATLRYDRNQAFEEKMSISTDRKALFFRDGKATIERMMSHQRLLFQFVPYNSSATMTTFDLSGLAQAVEPLREACGWSEAAMQRAERNATMIDQLLPLYKGSSNPEWCARNHEKRFGRKDAIQAEMQSYCVRTRKSNEKDAR